MATGIRSSTRAASALGSTHTIAAPSGATTNDIVLVFCSVYDSADVPAVSGGTGTWSTPVLLGVTAGDQRDYYAWKRATGAESGNYTISSYGTDKWVEAGAVAVTGVDSGVSAPVEDVDFAANTGTAFPAVSVTTTDGDPCLLWWSEKYNGGANVTPPTGFTELQDGGEINSLSYRLPGAAGTYSTSGGTGSTASDDKSASLLAIKSGSAGASPGTFVTTAGTATAAGGVGKMLGDGHPGLVAAVGSGGRFLVDDLGNPVLPQFDTIWPMVQQAGNTARNGGSATWQQDIDYWVSNRASQGFTALKWCLLGQAISGAPNDDSRTWDTKYPFGSTAAGSAHAAPSTGLASDYFTRVDYLLAAAADAGLTCFVHLFYSDDLDSSGSAMHTGGGALMSSSEFTALGTALASRYSGAPGLVWVIGGDYFDTARTEVQATLTALAAGGDEHLVTVQNWANDSANTWTTSRKDSSGTTQNLGTAVADVNALYTYEATYTAAAAAWAETPTIPSIWYDGYYDQDSGDALTQRRFNAWALTYGAPGAQYGSEGLWDQPSGWRTEVGTPNAVVAQLVAIRDAIAGLDGWQNLVPDTGSAFITAGRGSGNTYVTGGITADGSLAVLYIPDASSAVTLDTTQMVAGYAVTWVDPTSGATSAGTPGTSFSKGNNAAGAADWLLVLAEPVATPATFSTLAGSATATGGTTALTGGATFATAVGTATGTGGAGTLLGAATFSTSAGVATADGGVGSLVGSAVATFSTLAGSATAAGGTGAATGGATFVTAAGSATAAGGVGTLVGSGGAAHTVNVTDPTGLTDGSTSIGMEGVGTDPLDLTDTVTIVKEYLTDSIGLTDSGQWVGLLGVGTDPIGLDDTITTSKTTTSGFFIVINDTITLGESDVGRIDWSVDQAETVVSSDEEQVAFTPSLTGFSETISLSDLVTVEHGIGVGFNLSTEFIDNLSLSDVALLEQTTADDFVSTFLDRSLSGDSVLLVVTTPDSTALTVEGLVSLTDTVGLYLSPPLARPLRLILNRAILGPRLQDWFWRHDVFLPQPTQIALLLWRDGTVLETDDLGSPQAIAADFVAGGGHETILEPDSWQAQVLAGAGYVLEEVT